MEIIQSQKAKAKLFKELHHRGKILVLPNIWDPLGAALLQNLGYPAIATASASVAFTNGYDDGEHIPFKDVLMLLSKITASVDLPVTADIESGYSRTQTDLQKNIELLLGTGIVGINFEDYDKQTESLFPLEVQCERIGLIRKISEAFDVPLFINARTDVYLRGKVFITEEEKLSETIRRGKAYIEAGADGVFAPAMKIKDDLEKLIAALKCPVNVIALPGIPDIKSLQQIGVARLSLGPGFLKVAIKAMKDLAIKLKNHEGLDEVLENDITTTELRNLVLKK